MTPVIIQIPNDISESEYLSVNIKGSGGFILEIYDLEKDKVIEELGTLEIFEFFRDKTIPLETELLADYT